MRHPVYTYVIDNVTIGDPVQDIFALLAPNTLGVRIESIHLAAAGVTAPAQVRMRLKRLGGGVITPGSGGTTVAAPAQVSDAVPIAAAATVRANDTTQATVAGPNSFTAVLAAFQWNVLNPFDWPFFGDDDDGSQHELAAPGEALILDLPAPLGAPVTVSGFIRWREVPLLVPNFSGQFEV